MRRKILYGQTKAQRQADWLASFADSLVTRHPDQSGRIDWEAAKHFVFNNLSVSEAIKQYCESRGISKAKP